MEKKNYEEILEILQEKLNNVDDFAFGEFDQNELS